MQEEVSHPPLVAGTFGLRGAFQLGLALVISLAVVAILLAVEKSQRSARETVAERVSVTDRQYFKPPRRKKFLAQPAVHFGGKPLKLISKRKLRIRDTKVSFAGIDDNGLYRLYTAAELPPLHATEVEIKGQPVYLLKAEPDRYLRVQSVP